MKGKTLGITAVAFLMGLGVAVGAHQNSRVEKVDALDQGTEVYLDLSGGDWSGDNAVMAIWNHGAGAFDVFSLDARTTLYKATLSDETDAFTLFRGSKANWDNVYNQSDDGNFGGHNLIKSKGFSGNKMIFELGDIEIPEEDGYYVVGTESDWKFAGATKMSPGTDGNKAQIIKYPGKAGESFKARSFITGQDKWYGASNYEVGSEDKFLNIYVNSNDELIVEDWAEPDIPSEEGYYIKGSVIGWKYDTALKMTNTDQGGNVAYLMNYEVKAVNEKVRICSYYTDRTPYNQWADVGNTGELAVDFGTKDGDDFKFTKTGFYDFYAKYEKKQGDESAKFYFYVSEHAITYNIQMTGVLFEGKVRTSTVDLGIQLAYKGQTFNPELSDITGYVRRGVFTDANCTVEYTPSVFTGADNLYVKYIKVGFYILHSDSTPEYSIDGADLMITDGISPQNKAEGTIVATIGTTFSVGEYKADGTMGGQFLMLMAILFSLLLVHIQYSGQQEIIKFILLKE